MGVALELFRKAAKLGIHATIEHPATAYAWICLETRTAALEVAGAVSLYADGCAFGDVGKLNPKKLLRFMTTAPWMNLAVKRCPKNHDHAKHYCGEEARKSARYPDLFVQSLTGSCLQVLEILRPLSTRAIKDAHGRLLTHGPAWRLSGDVGHFVLRIATLNRPRGTVCCWPTARNCTRSLGFCRS